MERSEPTTLGDWDVIVVNFGQGDETIAFCNDACTAKAETPSSATDVERYFSSEAKLCVGDARSTSPRFSADICVSETAEVVRFSAPSTVAIILWSGVSSCEEISYLAHDIGQLKKSPSQLFVNNEAEER
jgi:hypothetical protein